MSNQLGLSVMINMLGGNTETVAAVKASFGKKITDITFSEDKLTLKFIDDTKLSIWDDGQSCCEHRYMHTDDKLKDFIGGKLMDIEVANAPDIVGEYGDAHEVQFLKVKTGKGWFTIETHNVHNGYYGGFSIKATLSV